MKNYILLLLALLTQIMSWAQNSGRINGKITDANNQPLGGATVTIRGTGSSTATDNNGYVFLHEC
jgi:hypothetical protein